MFEKKGDEIKNSSAAFQECKIVCMINLLFLESIAVASYCAFVCSRMEGKQIKYIPVDHIDEKGMRIFDLNDVLLNDKVFI